MLIFSDSSENGLIPNPTNLGSENPSHYLNEDKIDNSYETKTKNALTSLPSYLKHLISSNNANDKKYRGFCSFPHGCGNNLRTESLNSRLKPWPKKFGEKSDFTSHTMDEDTRDIPTRGVRCK